MAQRRVLYCDPCGVILPLRWVGINRMYSGLGYTRANSRLLAAQLNLLRKNQPNDDRLVEYLEQIRASAKLTAAPLEDSFQADTRTAGDFAELDGPLRSEEES